MPISKSRNVSSYVRVTLKWRALHAKTKAASVEMNAKFVRLTGGQRAEAERLLASDPALLACMAKPCRPTSPSPDGAGRA